MTEREIIVELSLYERGAAMTQVVGPIRWTVEVDERRTLDEIAKAVREAVQQHAFRTDGTPK